MSNTTTSTGGTTPAAPADHYSAVDLAKTGEGLKAKAVSTGAAGVSLCHYGNHHTMLTYRAVDGGAELHQNHADVFVIVSGKATLLTEGTIVDAKEESPGEIRGSAVTGGKASVIAEGDVVHISAGVPHQLMIAKGDDLTYFVMKVRKA
jgi:mannose-6-phosphate isomerase-like protein (cupin superfamily)